MRGERRQAAWTPDTGAAGPGTGTPEGRGPRWATSLRALVVLLAMAAAAAGVLWLEQAGSSAAAAQLASQEPAKVAVPPLAAAAGTASPARTVPTRTAPAAGPPGDGDVVVHVAGAVRHPGVYALPAGSRIQQALGAAGGVLPDGAPDALNLAAVAVDGTQILVPTRAQVLAGTGGAGTGGTGTGAAGAGTGAAGAGTGAAPGQGTAGTPGALLNLNTATAEQLDALPGVGPVLAARVVAWRTDHGPFTSVDELDAVSGIGPKMLANIRPLVTVR
ncbi:ComEA family DNA-binding protein [Arthrobacter dokdonensis]|uniref:ComEA family DNA-binding protein n=1 Tax=Arthrobacter dokdonellae TaxID=2211210 RepID=UPI001494D7AF|nr:ComEA family DNA-binding protein [Arthrobacter dokdonellae]